MSALEQLAIAAALFAVPGGVTVWYFACAALRIGSDGYWPDRWPVRYGIAALASLAVWTVWGLFIGGAAWIAGAMG
jgi:hypothetical protein